MSKSTTDDGGSEAELALLRGKRVLVVEDNGLLSLVLEETLRGASCTVLGPYGRLTPALAAVASGMSIDAAVLDINLNGEVVTPLAAELRERGVPFVVTSAYQDADVPLDLQDAVQLRKPYSDEALLKQLVTLVSSPVPT